MPWKTIKSLVFVIAISTLQCCSYYGNSSSSQVVQIESDEPGVADAQALIRDAVPRNSEGRLKVISIAKSGGRRLKVADTDAYELWYAVTAELTQDALWSPAAYKRFSTLPAGSKESFFFRAGKAGERVTIPGTLTFLKDKNGWTMQKDERY
jgi:hypothetical protein